MFFVLFFSFFSFFSFSFSLFVLYVNSNSYTVMGGQHRWAPAFLAACHHIYFIIYYCIFLIWLIKLLLFVCFSYLGWVCLFYFCFLCVLVYFLKFVLSCQYQCKWLPGKTRIRKDLIRVERDVNSTHSISHWCFSYLLRYTWRVVPR